MCRSCRSARAKKPRPPRESACRACGGPLVTKNARLYCSPQCSNSQAPIKVHPCADCGETKPVRYIDGKRRLNVWLCEPCRAERRKANNRRKNAKRRGATFGRSFTVKEIGDRDGWRCHLCKRTVDKALPGTDQQGPTIDHLVPIADGGLDDPANVALAHRLCNVRRADKGRAQLRLIA